MDIQTLIRSTIVNNWNITNPSIVDGMFRYDEFDPKWEVPIKDSTPLSQYIQILLENFPEKKTYICNTSSGKQYKIEHTCRITIYFKLIRYHLDNVTAFKTTFFNLKSEIDRILALKKFLISNITNLDISPSGWNDKMTIAVGRGIKTKKEPIVWESEQTVTAIYYIYGA